MASAMRLSCQTSNDKTIIKRRTGIAQGILIVVGLTMIYSLLPHPTGVLSIIATDEGLEQIRFDASYPSGAVRCHDHAILRETSRQLDAYFAHDLREFDLPLVLKG